MHKPCWALLLALGALDAGIQGAAAETLAERQTTAAEDAKLAEPLATTNTHCGTDLIASIEWPGFLQHKDKLPFATGDCEAALQNNLLDVQQPGGQADNRVEAEVVQLRAGRRQAGDVYRPEWRADLVDRPG